MAGYRFYPTADVRQDQIWNYTIEKWGEAQAKKYIQGLHTHLESLTKRLIPWRKLPKIYPIPRDIDIEIYFSRYDQHYIFFRELPGSVIGVMNILHESMDIPVRLREDLEKLIILEE